MAAPLRVEVEHSANATFVMPEAKNRVSVPPREVAVSSSVGRLCASEQDTVVTKTTSEVVAVEIAEVNGVVTSATNATPC